MRKKAQWQPHSPYHPPSNHKANHSPWITKATPAKIFPSKTNPTESHHLTRRRTRKRKKNQKETNKLKPNQKYKSQTNPTKRTSNLWTNSSRTSWNNTSPAGKRKINALKRKSKYSSAFWNKPNKMHLIRSSITLKSSIANKANKSYPSKSVLAATSTNTTKWTCPILKWQLKESKWKNPNVKKFSSNLKSHQIPKL